MQSPSERSPAYKKIDLKAAEYNDSSEVNAETAQLAAECGNIKATATFAAMQSAVFNSRNVGQALVAPARLGGGGGGGGAGGGGVGVIEQIAVLQRQFQQVVDASNEPGDV